MLRAIEQPLPVSSFLHPRSPALCDDCIMQSLQTAITLAPHHPPRVSWLATPPAHRLHQPPPRARPPVTWSVHHTPLRSHFFSLTRRVNPHPRNSRSPSHPHPCALAAAPCASSSPAARGTYPRNPCRLPLFSLPAEPPPYIRCARFLSPLPLYPGVNCSPTPCTHQQTRGAARPCYARLLPPQPRARRLISHPTQQQNTTTP